MKGRGSGSSAVVLEVYIFKAKHGALARRLKKKALGVSGYLTVPRL